MCKHIDAYTKRIISAGGYPILKECCLENDWHYDYVMELQRTTRESGDTRLTQSIKTLLAHKEIILERGMISGSLNVTGCIFTLKQHSHGWTDRPKVDTDSEQVVEAFKILSTFKQKVIEDVAANDSIHAKTDADNSVCE